MNLNLDGKTFEPQPGQRLLDLVREAGMDTEKLSDRPIAAKIAGEVFTLNYIPVRQQDTHTDRPSMRRAMAASNGEVHLLHYRDDAGKECYIRTAQFVIFLALRQLWPGTRVKMNFPAEEDEVERMKEAIRGIRNIRTQMNVPPKQKAQVIVVSADEKVQDIFRRGGSFLAPLAFATEVTVQADRTGILTS